MLRVGLLFFLILTFISAHLQAQTFELKELEAEVLRLKNEKKYELALSLAEDVIYDSKSTNIQKYDAYFLKYLIYKSLLNHTKAIDNLNAAEKFGLESELSEKVQIRVEVERLFIAFDLLRHDEVQIRIKNIDNSKLKYLENETRAFYLSILAIETARKRNYDSAHFYLDSAKNVLLDGSLIHLPLVYRKKVDLYRETKEYDKLYDSYITGLYYAEKYNVDLYLLGMYEAIFEYYRDKKDFKNLFETQLLINQITTRLNTNNFSAQLTNLENENILKETNKKVELQQKIIYSLSAFLLLSILGIVFFFLKLKKSQKKFNELEIQIDLLKEDIIQKKHIQQLEPKINYQKYNLSERQLEIIELARIGKTNKQIADELEISENTVKYHLKNIFQILDIENRSDLI